MSHSLLLYSRWIARVAIFCIVTLFSFQSNAMAEKYKIPANHTLHPYEETVIQLVNKERKKYHLKPLQIDTALSYTARVKSEDMRDNNYFNHNSPKYGSPKQMVNDFGISYHYGVGENIAFGQKTPEEVVKAWMNSPGHRENILNKKYTHIGVGYTTGGEYGTYWTQQFIGR